MVLAPSSNVMSQWQSGRCGNALELAKSCSKEHELSIENSNMYTMGGVRAC